jgi:hypothetical protein
MKLHEELGQHVRNVSLSEVSREHFLVVISAPAVVGPSGDDATHDELLTGRSLVGRLSQKLVSQHAAVSLLLILSRPLLLLMGSSVTTCRVRPHRHPSLYQSLR